MEQRRKRLLASQERKAAAISELAAALKEDHDGWEAEREVWAQEKAAVEARLSSEERQVTKLKQEVKRLGRGVHVGKQDKERLARESEGLRQENRKLTARNEKLEARNLEVRRQIDTLVERNKRLQATMARELLSSSNSNDGGGDNQAAAPMRTEASGSGSGQAKVVANIVIPPAALPSAAGRSSVSDAIGQGGSSRRPRPDQCSDADEVTTPKDTTTAGRGGPPAGRGRSKAKRGEGGAWNWPGPSGTTEPARAERQGVEAKKRPRRRSVDGFYSDPKDNAGAGAGARTEAVYGESVIIKSERVTANARGDFDGHNGSSGGGGGGGSGGSGHGSSRAPLAVALPGPASEDCFVAVNLVKKRPRNHHSNSSRSSSSSSTGSSSSTSRGGGSGGGTGGGGGGEATMKVRSNTRDAQREGGSASLGRMPPASSAHRAIAPAASDKLVPTATPRSSSSSSSSSSSAAAALSKRSNAPLERKRARLSLGPEDRRPAAGGGGVVEITEVLEQRPARGARSARSNVNNFHEPPRQVRFTSPALAKEEEEEEDTKVVGAGAVKAGGGIGGGGQPRDSSSANGVGVEAGVGVGTRMGASTEVEAGVGAGARARAKNVSSVIQSLLEAVPMTGKEESRLGFGDDPPSPPPAGRRVGDERPGLKQAAAEQQRGQGRRGGLDEQPQGVSGWDAKGSAAANPPMHTFEQRSGRSDISGIDDPDRSFRENSRRRDEPLRPSNGDNRASTRELPEEKSGTGQGGRGSGGGGAGWENAVLAARVTGPAAMPEAIYPQLAMATVNSPKKSKPSRRRRQQQQQQQQWQDQRQYPEQDQHQYPERDRDQDQNQNQQFHAAESRPVAAGEAVGGYPCARRSEVGEEDAGRSEGVRRRGGAPVVDEGDRLKYAKPSRHNLPLPSERTSGDRDADGEGPKERNDARCGAGAVDYRGRGKASKGRGGSDGVENGGKVIGSMGGNGSGGGGVVTGESGQSVGGGGKGDAGPRGSAEAPATALRTGGAGEGGGGASERRGTAVATVRRKEVENPYREGNDGEEGGGSRGRERGRGGGGGGGAGGREGSREGGGGYEQRSPKKYKYQEVVRDRFKRAAMKGHDCEHCEAYLAAVGGSPGERQAMLNMCSRHKHTEANGRPAETPDGFWDLSFADSVSSDKELELLGRRHNGGGGGVDAGRLARSDSQIDF